MVGGFLSKTCLSLGRFEVSLAQQIGCLLQMCIGDMSMVNEDPVIGEKCQLQRANLQLQRLGNALVDEPVRAQVSTRVL